MTLAATDRVAGIVQLHYGHEVLSVARHAEGMGTVNWHVRTAGGDYFLKQYPATANLAGEAAALRLSQFALAHGIPAPRVLPALDGRLLWSGGGAAVALFDWVAGATSGVPLTRQQMAQMGRTLGRLHRLLTPLEATFGDTADGWLVLDVEAKHARLEQHLRTIARREEHDEFDRRTTVLLRRRIELLPAVAKILASLSPLSRQVLHGDYNVCNVLFRGSELVAVVDFRPPERFLNAFEIGRSALSPQTMTAGPWLGSAVAFIEEYCAANPDIPLDDVRYAPHIWAAQLVRSEYGVKQHYNAPLEYQADLDRFWFQRCEAAEMILANLDDITAHFTSAWEQR